MADQTDVGDVLRHEVTWLTTALGNAELVGGFSPEYLRGFRAAVGWVAFHAERGTLPELDDEAPVDLAGPPRRRETAMEVQVSALRYANYGDHAQLDHHALAYDPTETVEALVLRALDLRSPYARTNLESDHVVLRVIKGTEPERVGRDVPPF